MNALLTMPIAGTLVDRVPVGRIVPFGLSIVIQNLLLQLLQWLPVLLQVLAQLTMDPPTGEEYEAVRDQKATLLKAIRPLEDFGRDARLALRSLATLAYDCRRAEMFRGHLFDSLRLLDRVLGRLAGE